MTSNTARELQLSVSICGFLAEFLFSVNVSQLRLSRCLYDCSRLPGHN